MSLSEISNDETFFDAVTTDAKSFDKNIENHVVQENEPNKENTGRRGRKPVKLKISISSVDGVVTENVILPDLQSQSKVIKPKKIRQPLKDKNLRGKPTKEINTTNFKNFSPVTISKANLVIFEDDIGKEKKIDLVGEENDYSHAADDIEKNKEEGKEETKVKVKKDSARFARWSTSESRRKSGNPLLVKFDRPRYTMNDASAKDVVKENKIVTSVFSPVENNEANKKSSAKAITAPMEKKAMMEEDMTKLENIFPNVDPAFLKAQYKKMKGSLENTVDLIVLKNKISELPTKEDHLKRLEVEKIRIKYENDFSVEKFLKLIPDPWNFFLNTEIHNCPKYAQHSLYYLKNKFKKHFVQTIENVLARLDYSLYRANEELSNKKKNRMLKMRITDRSRSECDAGKPTTVNFQFLQEVAFIEHESDIMEKLRKTKSARQKRLMKILKSGNLLQCQFCSRDNLSWEDSICCVKNHVFCTICLNKHVVEEVRKKNFVFKCLLECEEVYPIEWLQDLVNPDLMAVIVRRNQIDLIKSSGIDEVSFCPNCYYITFLPPEDTVLCCLNPCCMKETCRYCQLDSHDSLTCKESFKVDDALPKYKFDPDSPICFHCKNSFYKDEDSNKMLCSCGCIICYICRQPYPVCPHFIDENNQRTPSNANEEPYEKLIKEESTYIEGKHFDVQEDSCVVCNPSDVFPDFVSTDSSTF